MTMINTYIQKDQCEVKDHFPRYYKFLLDINLIVADFTKHTQLNYNFAYRPRS